MLCLILGVILSGVVMLMEVTPAWGKSPGQDVLDQGAQFYQAGRFEEALSAFKQATELDPGLLKAWENLGWAYRKLERNEEAIHVWDIVLKLEPGNVTLINEIGSIYMSERAWSKGVSQFKESLRLEPAQPEILFRLAQCYEALGRQNEALHFYQASETTYQAALKKYPMDSEGLGNLGWTQRKQAKTQEAVKTWKRAIQLDPKQTLLYRHLADAYLELDKITQARIGYEKAWKQGLRIPEVAYHLAEISFREQRFQQGLHWLDLLFNTPRRDQDWSLRIANLFLGYHQPELGVAFFKKRLPISGSVGETRKALSRLYAFQGGEAEQQEHYPEAIDRYQQALEFDPDSASVLRDLGWAYWKTSRWDLCEKTWKRYAKAYPTQPESYNLLTQFYMLKRSYKAAIDSITISLKLVPDQPAQKLKVAKALFWDNQFEKAKIYSQTIAAQYPKDLHIQFFWGEILMQYHDFKRGKAQWRKVLDLGSDSPRAQYYWLRSLYALGEYDTALREARRIIARQGPKQAIIQFLAEDAVIREDKAEAARWYELLVQHFPERPSYWIELSRLYREIGYTALAHQILERARAIHPDHLEILLDLAESYYLDRRYDKAYEEFLGLITQYPNNRRAFIGMLHTLVESKRFESALRLLEQNRPTFLKDYELDLLKGRIFAALGKTADAQSFFSRVSLPMSNTRYIPVYIPILLYHGLGDHLRSASLPVALFDSQLRALRDNGYTAITVRELGRMTDGKRPFPKKPILITFDDARIDSFQMGDPVLAKYNMKATMFVPTARILDKNPFFADWEMIRFYEKTGRWDLQGHGHHAHDLIPTDETEQMGGFLVNRQWLESEGRLETQDEYLQRLDQDYQEAIEQLNKNIPGLNVIGYAFPFSEAGQENVGNEPRAAEFNERLIFKHYRYGFVQDQSGYNQLLPSTSPMMLRRFSVDRSWDGERLIRHLADHDPANLARIEMGKSFYWRGRNEKSREVFQQLAMEEPLLRGDSEFHLAAVSYQQEKYREAQKHLEVSWIQDAEPSNDGQKLMNRILWENHTHVENRSGVFHDSNQRSNWWESVYLRYPFPRPVDLWMEGGVIQFQEEGLPDLLGQELSIGTSWNGLDRIGLEGKVRQRFMDRVKNTQNIWLEGKYQTDLQEVKLQWSYEDVETLRAHQIDLQARTYIARYLIDLMPQWQGQMNFSYQDYEDSNNRIDFRIGVTHRFLLWPDWQVSGVFTRSDTRFQSNRYYTPEGLNMGSGIASYQHRWDSGWALEGEVGLGMAEDTLNGTRWVSHSKLRAVQGWTPYINSNLGWEYSNSPSYRSWTLEGTLRYRF